jgi:pimeloyl-ACP methyl ester carboxylesterase
MSPLIVCVHGIGSNGRYFDLQHNSMAREAAKRGIATLLIDRPGYGNSAEPAPGSAINHGVEAITALLEDVVKENFGLAERPLVLIGHSFGGAIVLSYAARQHRGAISSICVSGIGDRPTIPYLDERKRNGIDLPVQLSPHWFFGPGNTFDRRGVTALRVATEPQRSNEGPEIAYDWPKLWPTVAAAISCPVHFRLAEFERIWEATPADIDRIANSFALAPHVDAAILPDGGHLYEAHLRGNELVSAQLDFVQNTNRIYL